MSHQRISFAFALGVTVLIFIGGLLLLVTTTRQDKTKFTLVCTTTIVADAVKHIVGDTATVQCLMGPGVDPHLYRPTYGDMQKLFYADMIVYNGLHLEGKMADLFASLRTKKITYAMAHALGNDVLLASYGSDVFDPHVWHDVLLWSQCVRALGNALACNNPDHAQLYQENTQKYCSELENLHAYVILEVQKIPEKQRILVTAHDAFRYFGLAYGIHVEGLQGTSTDSEISISDVQKVAQFIVEKKIKTIFLESSIPGKGIEALHYAVGAAGWHVGIGEHLYSDTLMEGEHESAYAAMIQYNVQVIVTALQ